MPRCVSNDANTRIVKVSSTIVMAVSAVRSGRRRMVEMPMLIAAITVLKREMSATWIVLVIPCIAFSSVSNFCMMMKITSDDSTTTVKPRKMMIGVCATANAGCERYRTTNVTRKNTTNQITCL